MSTETLTITSTPNTIKCIKKLMLVLSVAIENGGGISLHTYLPDDSTTESIDIDDITEDEYNDAVEFVENIYNHPITDDVDFQGDAFSMSGAEKATITIDETE